MSKKMYEIIETIGDLKIRVPLSGGKAGRNAQKTSNMQVFNSTKSMIESQFRFSTSNFESRYRAYQKALAFAKRQNIK